MFFGKSKQTQPETPNQSANASNQNNDLKQEQIYNLIILDASGSMYSIKQSALSGVNETIQTIKKSQQEEQNLKQYLTFVSFNSGRNYLKTHYELTPIDDAQELSSRSYDPDNCTALYDAIGESITKLDKQIPENAKVLVTIVTDGMENASKYYDSHSIAQLIKSFENKDWVFSYIGANQNSFVEARKIGIQNSMNWENTNEGSRRMWEVERENRRRFYKQSSCGNFSKMNYFMQRNPEINCGVTPTHISMLGQNEIFVFGSNVDGSHAGGAAKYAVDHFGAIPGMNSGLQGKSYAIPTVEVGINAIRACVDQFTEFARTNPDKQFLVTEIGCGNGGWNPCEIAILFRDAAGLSNVCLPKIFINFIMGS